MAFLSGASPRATEPGPAPVAASAPATTAPSATAPAAPAAAAPTPLHPGDVDIIGAVGTWVVRPDESLIEIARDKDVGFNEITAANPDLDPFVPGTGTTLVIPTSWILPRDVAPGIVVVNLSEMRLYYSFVPEGRLTPVVATFPIGIGDEGWDTPVGVFEVVEKLVNPPWYPPASIRKEDPELPPVVPPGPENPLGTHALRLSSRSILIHGTNRPYAIGRRATHGCLRLYPEDIVRLFPLVPKGARVVMVREPVKVGLSGDRVFVEVHEDPMAMVDPALRARQLLFERGLLERVSKGKLERALERRSGLPVDVTSDGFGPRSLPGRGPDGLPQ
jgi:L,D-transpeptidase ErfK/SrfK